MVWWSSTLLNWDNWYILLIGVWRNSIRDCLVYDMMLLWMLMVLYSCISVLRWRRWWCIVDVDSMPWRENLGLNMSRWLYLLRRTSILPSLWSKRWMLSCALRLRTCRSWMICYRFVNWGLCVAFSFLSIDRGRCLLWRCWCVLWNGSCLLCLLKNDELKVSRFQKTNLGNPNEHSSAYHFVTCVIWGFSYQTQS